MSFSEDGKVSGNGGCNSYHGSYESTLLGTLSVTDIISTLMLCIQPGVMDQEHDFMDALKDAESYDIQSGELRISGGGKLMVLSPA